jgi:hypothetical protein
MNHTPGPWVGIVQSVGNMPKDEYIAIEDLSRKKYIAEIPGNWEQDQANACLITAAPEMLKLLREATQNAKRIGCTGAWLLIALRVIAEAEGRAK